LPTLSTVPTISKAPRCRRSSNQHVSATSRLARGARLTVARSLLIFGR
jgi:hypothetical protein